jgi:hypothetical protein
MSVERKQGRFMGLSYDCAKARAPYESPRINPAADQAGVPDEDDGEDPREALKRTIRAWIEADEAEKAERAIDVTPASEPVVIEVKPNPNPDDEGIDGELA